MMLLLQPTIIALPVKYATIVKKTAADPHVFWVVVHAVKVLLLLGNFN